MPSLAVLKTLLRELTATRRAPRIPEPALVMDDAAQVEAYVEAGRPNGVMAPVYLFHAAHACDVMKPGDLVLDLACGPANQLSLIASMNPECRFIGVDLSEPMLGQARELASRGGLRNIEFRRGDVSRLDGVEDGSVDVVISTMALHHLPTADLLHATLSEAARVLRHAGGIYIVDFGHLKSERSIAYFANQHAHRQPSLFTVDYLHSLRAAFSLADWRNATAALDGRARLYSTFLAPYMVALKSGRRRSNDAELRKRVERMAGALRPYQRTDLRDLSTFFRLGGLRTPLLD